MHLSCGRPNQEVVGVRQQGKLVTKGGGGFSKQHGYFVTMASVVVVEEEFDETSLQQG